MEEGTAIGVWRRSRPAGPEPADAILCGLVAEAWRHGDTVPSLGATPRQHSRSSLGLHTRAKAMHLRTVAAVGLEGTLGHRTVLIRESLPYGQVLSIADPVQIRQSSHSRTRSRRTGIVRCPFSSSLLHAQQHGIAATNRTPSLPRIFIFACRTSSRASRLCRQLVEKLEHLRGRFTRLHKQWCNTIFC